MTTTATDPAELARQATLIPALQRAALTDGAGICTTCGRDVFTTAGTDRCEHVHRQAQGIEPDAPEDEYTQSQEEGVYSDNALTRDDASNTPNTPNTPNTAQESDESYRARLLAQIRDGAWLDTQEFDPVQWIVPGLIAEGCGLMVAPPKIGKSWLALDIGLGVAAGGKVLGEIHVKPRPVLYLALEDGDRRMQTRCRKLLGGADIPPEFQYATVYKDRVDVLAVMQFWLEDHPAGLIMLDTLGKVMQPARQGQGAYERDYGLVGDIKAITDSFPGSAAIIVHHTRKAGSGDFMDDTSGTNGLNGAADWTLNVKRGRGDSEGRLLITGRDVGDGDYAVEFDAGTWTLHGTDLLQAAQQAVATQSTSGLKKGSDRDRVVALIAHHPNGIRSAEVALSLGWEGKRATNTLSKLNEAHRIRKIERGLYAPLTSSGVLGVLGVSDTETPSQSGNPNTPPPGEDRVYSASPRLCTVCGEPLVSSDPAVTIHPNCEPQEPAS